MPLSLRNRVKALLQRSNAFLTPNLLVNPSLSSKLFAYRPTANEFVLDFPDPERDSAGLPIPPKSLRMGEIPAQEFCETGLEDVESMRRVLAASGHELEGFSSILEYGCSSGRMLRCLHRLAAERDIWGVDIASEHIYWCQRFLSPIKCATVTTAPHLPFEDRSFDFIYAGSVFTHVEDLADATFLELRRILKPGGLLYVTILGTDSLQVFEEQRGKPLFDMILGTAAYKRFRSSEARMFVVGRSVFAYVFYDTEQLVAHLSKFFDVLRVEPRAYRLAQTALLLRKKA
ncbi:class I SAM-dependent methyltransferase [bacterium CPR1]|nr:class I SAM-dependent methyltransferase [bacterium CPR1]